MLWDFEYRGSYYEVSVVEEGALLVEKPYWEALVRLECAQNETIEGKWAMGSELNTLCPECEKEVNYLDFNHSAAVCPACFDRETLPQGKPHEEYS